MSNLKSAVKARLLNDMIRAVCPPSGWKILVVDAVSVRILSSVCSMSDILEEQVSLIETLTKARQPYPQKEAIYFIAPITESVNAIIDDHARGQPLYAAAHIYLTSSLPERLLDKLRRSAVSPFIRTLRELNVDFLVTEPNIFSLGIPDTNCQIYNPPSDIHLKFELEAIAKRLCSVLVALGEYPQIRYFSSSKVQFGKLLADLVQKEVDEYGRIDSSYPPPSNFSPAIMLILDRSLDAATPLVHEFTYQAMIQDLLPLENGKYKYEPDNGPPALITLDENDSVWMTCRHWHIADVATYLSESVKKLTSDNAAAQFEVLQSSNPNAFVDKIAVMKDTISALPQYQELKKLYAIHTKICADCMNAYQQNNLEIVSKIEQEMVTGETADGKAPKHLSDHVLSALENTEIAYYDRVRLLMLYLISQNGIRDDERQKFFNRGDFAVDISQALTNLSLMGVRLSASYENSKPEPNPFSSRKLGVTENQYENSRYVPPLKFVMEDTLRGILDRELFPYIRPPPEDAPSPGITSRSTVTSFRSTKASWATRKSTSLATADTKPVDLRSNGPRVILFVVGGISYSEIRSCYQLISDFSREIIIGSTHLSTPNYHVNMLKVLHKGGPISTSFDSPKIQKRPVRQEEDSVPSRFASRSVGFGIPGFPRRSESSRQQSNPDVSARNPDSFPQRGGSLSGKDSKSKGWGFFK